MVAELLTIRQMCDAFQVTARTLRFYETKELIRPQRTGQKRLYNKRDRARVTLILRGKRFGFSLEEIRQLLDLYDIGDQQITQITCVLAAARGRLALMKDQHEELGRAIIELAEHIDWGEATLAQKTRQSA